jgi:hypothetical protein
MIRSTRGLVLLATIIGITSCTGDPTADLRTGVSQLVASPSTIFVNQGDSVQVIVSPVNGQGGEVAITGGLTLTPTTGVAGHVDTTFRMTFDQNGKLTQPASQNRFRLYVRGDDLVAGKVTISGGGVSLDVPVTVLPTDLAATFSKTAPTIFDTVTVTAPAGLTFGPTSQVSFAGETDTTIVVARAADGSSISVIPAFGTKGPATITGIIPAYAPSLSINLTSTVSVTKAASGNDALATAPTIPIPAAGATFTLYDGGAFAPIAACTGLFGGNCYVYKLDLSAGGRTFQVNATWNEITDLGIYFMNSAGTAQVGTGACDAKGDGSSGQPESCTQTFAAGVYYMVVDSFGPFYPDPDPTAVLVQITGQ